MAGPPAIGGEAEREQADAGHQRCRPEQQLEIAVLFLVRLNEFEIVDRSLGIGAAELESRHIRMDGGQAILQSLSEIVVVEFAVSKCAKRWSVNMRAPAPLAHGVTSSAEGLEQGFASALLGIEGMTGRTPAAHHAAYRQEGETKNPHGQSLISVGRRAGRPITHRHQGRKAINRIDLGQGADDGRA
jgi:hypothetical protein